MQAVNTITCKFRCFFEKVRWQNFLPKSEWQLKARLVKTGRSPKIDSEEIALMLYALSAAANTFFWVDNDNITD